MVGFLNYGQTMAFSHQDPQVLSFPASSADPLASLAAAAAAAAAPARAPARLLDAAAPSDAGSRLLDALQPGHGDLGPGEKILQLLGFA